MLTTAIQPLKLKGAAVDTYTLSVPVFLSRSRQDVDSDLNRSARSQKYRPPRKSGVVHLETIDEDFTVPVRRLRALPPSSASFREVNSGLGAANRAMEQLSRVGQKQPQSRQPRRLRDNLEPTYDNFVFDDFVENIVST